MKSTHLTFFAALGLVACGASRDVDVSGEVSAPAELAKDDAVIVSFYEREGDVEDAAAEFIHSSRVESLGAFVETVPVVGDTLTVVAIVDRDGDDACTDGEPWAMSDVTVSEEDTAEVVLVIESRSACPVLD